MNWPLNVEINADNALFGMGLLLMILGSGIYYALREPYYLWIGIVLTIVGFLFWQWKKPKITHYALAIPRKKEPRKSIKELLEQ